LSDKAGVFVAARRLGAGDHHIESASEVTVLCRVAEKVPVRAARTEILQLLR
jgi:hypothetical protein